MTLNYQSGHTLSLQLHSVQLRLEAAQSQHDRIVQGLQEQMSQLVPGARVAELQHLLSLREEEAERLNAQQVSGDVLLQAAAGGGH